MPLTNTYGATWCSYSSLTDFKNCPRAYFLKNVYRDPKTNRKIQITTPALSLGSAVHEVLESLRSLKTAERFRRSLIDRFGEVWRNYQGQIGGFVDQETEREYKKRGEEMLRGVMNEPGPLAELTVKIKEDLPSYWLSKDDKLILCGKVDWLKYHPEDESVEIIDFKTGRRKEAADSLQLPIYRLLVENVQPWKVRGASYWYLADEGQIVPQDLPSTDEAQQQVLREAKKMALARKLGVFKCPAGESGCLHCRGFEKILSGGATLVGEGNYGQALYILNRAKDSDSMPDNEIL